MPPHTKLRITSLKYISLVDRGAQGAISNVALAKRAPSLGEEFNIVAKVASTVPKLGIVFGYALASSVDGGKSAHVDLQNDAVLGGDELIKVAAEFAESGAYSDVMHAGGSTGPVGEGADGRVLFMLPLTDEVKKALKLHGDIEGLAIGMKPSEEAFKRYESGELNAFSIAGTGERTTVEKTDDKTPKKKKKFPADLYKRVQKNAVLTSIEDGHQHTVCLDDPAHGWTDQLSTSYQTSEGAEQGHAHAWVYDATTGKVTIALDAGHSHTVEAVVPADVIAAAAAPDSKEQCCNGCGYSCASTDAYCPRCGAKAGHDSSAKPASVTVSIAARAPDATTGNSPQPTPTPTVKSQEPSMPTEQELTTENANLRKMLAASLALTEPQRLHVAKLAPDAVPAFLNADPTQREAMLKTAADADPEVYKTAGGASIRKSDGAAAFALAKQADEQALVIKSQSEALAIQKAAAEQTAFEKRATADLSHFAKSLDIRSLIVKAIDLVPATDDQRKEAHEALKGANKAMQLLGKAAGGDDDSKAEDKDDPKKKLDEMAKTLAKTYPADTKGAFAKAYVEVLGTAEGAALYEQLNTTPALRVVQ